MVVGRWRRRWEDAGSWEMAACAEFQEGRPGVVGTPLKIVKIEIESEGKISMATKKGTNQRYQGDKSEINMGLCAFLAEISVL